jgi:hypothetical protein
MQFRIISAFLIFIGSYLPLALILAIQDIPLVWWQQPICDYKNISNCLFNPFSNPKFSLIFIAITLTSVILSVFSLKSVSFPFNVQVESSKTISNDIINSWIQVISA